VLNEVVATVVVLEPLAVFAKKLFAVSVTAIHANAVFAAAPNVGL
jgi:hypothetical protein